MTLSLLEQVANAHTELSTHKHTPTSAMKTVAKRGVRQASALGDMDPVAVAVGRRVASGQPLSDQHVEEMASYHAAHDGPCLAGSDSQSAEDMLWGGSPGAQWSSARVAAIDVSQLSQSDSPSILQLDQSGKGISLEVFVRDGLGEPIHLDEDREMIWAPILRSGMLATRPGPNGEKKHEPLVFVPGLASDPRKEIGLQNLYDSFKAGAIQHVTIPTNHDNGVLDNTGFIKDLKIVDSKKRPGEKVLVAAHDFRDPDVRKKVELGTIANRSCGIVYDYVNTESGQSYDQTIDHVALTNRPWVTGMTPYGELDGDEFGDREVVPMLLSERPGRADLADATDSSWDGSASRFTDEQWARSCVLDRGAEVKGAKERYSLPIREPDGTLNSKGVVAAAGRIKQVKGASLSQKKAAARKLIAAYRQSGGQPPDDLRSLVGASTSLSERDRRDLLLADVQWGASELSMNDITSQVVSHLDEMGSADEVYPIFTVLDVVGNPDPKALVRCSYGDPDGTRDAWVIPLEVDGDSVSLSDFASWTPVQKEWVTDEDAAQDKEEVSSLLNGQSILSELGLAERTTAPDPRNPLEGGAMKPTTSEVLERLGLSEEQQSVIQKIVEDNNRLSTQLGEVTKETRKTKVEARVKELQEAKFPPGFCRRYEEIALADDGEVAAVLNLSDEKGNATGSKEYTATQIAESLISAIPVDNSGKLALAERADLLTSPISGRPPVDAEDQRKVEEKENKDRPASADEWLAEAEKVAPGSTVGLTLSTTKES
jgi:hypothetical protein